MLRRPLVWLHRWVGLVIAAFLILEGLTGSVLAFRVPLERAINPELFGVPGTSSPPDLATLAERAEAQEPHARIDYFSVDHDQVVVRVSPRVNPSSARPWPIGFDRVFLDPSTGRELGRRRESDLSQGSQNVVSFLYALHMELAAGSVGYWTLGIVALAWTVDCFVGLYLTMPAGLHRFAWRWAPAWRIKTRASAVRVNFDLHRAGGLWLWPILFVFAWSSVMFNLNPVYVPVMSAAMDYRDPSSVINQPGLHENQHPKLGWRDAQDLGARAMDRIAVERGFRILRPYGMAYIESFGVYTYAVESSLNVQQNAWSTSVWVDGDTGEIRDVSIPRGEHSGNTAETWLRALHFADVHNSTAYRVFVGTVGIVVVMLSITGIYLWWKKRRARHWGRARAEATGTASRVNRVLIRRSKGEI
ncbi:MAG: PepSY domain-containing protein [Proteobacteria bacterium]|nr:PepSY domain-containing protein [Pseudomonadota bacterium]